MTWIKNNWRYVVMTLAGIGTAVDIVTAYVAEDKTPTWQELGLTLGVGLFAWLKRAPGDLTKSQAEQRTSQALREVSATRRESMPELDLPGEH